MKVTQNILQTDTLIYFLEGRWTSYQLLFPKTRTQSHLLHVLCGTKGYMQHATLHSKVNILTFYINLLHGRSCCL